MELEFQEDLVILKGLKIYRGICYLSLTTMVVPQTLVEVLQEKLMA
jgi:hypothetical protein